VNILDAFSLKSKTAFVTGGAGNFGRPIVRALAEAGARVTIASRNLEALEKSAAEFRAESLDVRALRMDQGDDTPIHEAVRTFSAKNGALDILVNNAVARPVKNGYSSPASSIEESLHVNGTGLILVTRAFGEVLTDSGSIINIGSIMGLVGLEPLNYRDTDIDGLASDHDLMGAIVFFASDASAYITGTNLPVDGGYTSK